MKEALRKAIAEDKDQIRKAKIKLEQIKKQRKMLGIPDSSVLYSTEERDLESYITVLEYSIEDALEYSDQIEDEYEFDELMAE